MKGKYKNILFSSIIHIFIVLFLVSNSNFVIAAEIVRDDVPEIKVDVNYTGVKTSEAKEGIKRNENVLTRVSDVLLHGSSLYTYDSVTDNDLHGTEPGTSLTGDMGCVIVDKNGTPIESLDIDVQVFVNVSKEDVANGLYNDLGFFKMFFSEEVFKGTIEGCDDVLSATYGTYLTQKYSMTLEFNSDGTFSLMIPENMPEEYMLSITAIEDPVTGEKIEITKSSRLFIALGKGEEGDGTKPEPTPEEDDEKRYHSIKSTTTTYTDMEPSIASSISSDKYDVSKGIPTSENLNYSLTADKALYNISTRTYTLNAGVKNITINLYATYPQKHTEISYNESGDKIEKTWTTTETVTRTITKEFSYEVPTLTLYDVPVSNIYPVMTGSIQAVNGEYVLGSGGLTLEGSPIVYSQTINPYAKKPISGISVRMLSVRC